MTYLLLPALACLLLPDHDLSLLLVQQIKSINFLLRFLIAIKCNREGKESAMHEQFSFFRFLYNYYLTWAYAVCLEFICRLKLFVAINVMQTWRFDEMTPSLLYFLHNDAIIRQVINQFTSKSKLTFMRLYLKKLHSFSLLLYRYIRRAH